MFQITENERKIFDFIISGRENLKTTIVRDGLTVEKFLEKDCLTSEEIQAIYKVLPQDVEFYKFVNILHLAKFSTSNPGPSEDYKARIERLKAEQANREYKEMVKSVDMTQKFDLNTGFGQEIRAANRQMTAIFNTILTVGGAFVFGFFGIEYAAPRYKLDIALRMLIGLVLATVVFFADLYFIIKNMDMDEKPKNTGQPSNFPSTRQVTKKSEKLEEENLTETTRIESKAEEKKTVRARKTRREK